VERTKLILFGSGFETTKFLSAIRARARRGRRLEEEWTGGARAYGRKGSLGVSGDFIHARRDGPLNCISTIRQVERLRVRRRGSGGAGARGLSGAEPVDGRRTSFTRNEPVRQAGADFGLCEKRI